MRHSTIAGLPENRTAVCGVPRGSRDVCKQGSTHRIAPFVIAAMLAFSMIGCSKGPQEQARNKLVGELGIAWSEHEFLEAAKNGNDVAVALFLEGGMDSEVEDDNGRTALILASQAGHVSTLNVLIGNGADANDTDNSGKTALILACENDQPAVMLALLAKGVDVNAKATDGTTAVSAAEKRGDAETVKLLKEHGAK